MCKIKTGTDPAAFNTAFKMPSHSSPTRFSSVNYSKVNQKLSYVKVDSGYLYEEQLMEQLRC